MVEPALLSGESYAIFGFLLVLAVLVYRASRSPAAFGLALLGAGFLLDGLKKLATPVGARDLPPPAAILEVAGEFCMGGGLALLAFEGARLALRWYAKYRRQRVGPDDGGKPLRAPTE